MAKALYVTSLGKFSICYPTPEGPGLLTGRSGSSGRLWSFLQYLSVNHDRAVTQEEIFDILWNDLDSTNPASTVKTLLHRSRRMLEKLGFPDGKSVLRFQHGIYTWDPALEIRTDIDQFDRLCAAFDQDPSGEEGLDAARRARELYRGDFLPGAAGSPWTLSPRTYYHTKYMRLSCDLASALWELDRLEEAIDVCRTAAAADPYDEPCHLMMMRLLQASGAKQHAVQYYNEVSNLMMGQLGVAPSEELTALYRELAGDDRSNMPEMDLRTVLLQLQKKEQEPGAFFCEYGVFRDIYSLLVRSAARSGQVVQLALVTLLDLDGELLSPSRRSAAMDEMQRAIRSCCRVGDVYTQMSTCQCLLLLPSASYENALMVVKRILKKYRSTVLGRTTAVECGMISALNREDSRGPNAFRWKVSESRRPATG